MGNYVNSSSSSAGYAQQSAEARTQGILQRRQAYQQAYSLEDESRQNTWLALQNMSALRQNQTSAVSNARATAAASGFAADVGTQRTNQASVAQAYETQIANVNKSNVISDENARTQANAYRRYGDTALNLANIQADYYSKLSQISNKASWWYLLGDIGLQSSSLMMQLGGGDSASSSKSKSNSKSGSSSSGGSGSSSSGGSGSSSSGGSGS